MNIIEQVSVPQRIKEFALRLNKECNKRPIDNLVFTIGGRNIPDDAYGGYFPPLNMIRIYVDKCITNTGWMTKGASFITGIWLNLLMAVAHEFMHTWQAEDEPKLLRLKELPLDYDWEAWEVALDIIDEFSQFLQPPRIEDMGWIGQEITNLLNTLFVSNPSKVQEMLDFNGTAIGGDAVALATLSGKYEDEAAIGRLLQQIDEGRMGKKVGNKRYLTFEETVGVLNSDHAGNSQQNLSYEETMSVLKTHFMEV